MKHQLIKKKLFYHFKRGFYFIRLIYLHFQCNSDFHLSITIKQIIFKGHTLKTPHISSDPIKNLTFIKM